MRTALLITAVVSLFVIGAPVAPDARGAAPDALCIPIQVSPSTIVLDSQGTWVTVHADIAYCLVDTLSVTLDGIPVKFTKADDRGELVAKFIDDEVKEELSPGTVELTLRGTMLDGTPFVGTDTVRVITGGKD
jgi:hypothetical protein